MCFQALDWMLFAKCNTSFKAFMYTLHNKSSFNALIMSCNAPYDALYELNYCKYNYNINLYTF